MPLNRQRAQKYLQKFDFESLFIEELGWDTVDRVTLPFEVDGEPFEVVSITQKRGFTVFKCITPEIPTRPIRVKLDRQLTDYSKSHLLVFGDEGKTQQIWMWVRQELGKPLAPRFEQYQVGQSAERLLQKLEALAIAFAEEEKLTLVEVAQRVKKAFDVEKVTKKFFTRFEKEHGKFLQFIQGIQSEFGRTWYASLMLNRLMFVYFIQKKNFLDGDINYLRNRLKRCQAEWGTDTFHSFYRQFLLKLFHEGLGKPDRNPELEKLLGKIPYLNGGLFEVHQLEEKYDSTLQIPDAAFEQVFSFFDEYDWHLDDRPLRNQNEINPDVLGYIFEKYINQKQMGAYYTKEDITEYISKNTILPFLFDQAEKGCQVAFEPEGAVWALLRENPDHYIYPAVRQGVDIELPTEIAAGIEDVSQRGGWNKPAADGFALPTETWREYVARRKRCLELRQKLAAGEVTQINDLITYNLDIRQFAQDVITSCESSDLLKALYQAIEQVSVLDPTCGSGAFLFAALNILEPLYTACLERMQGFVDEDDLRLSQEPEAKPRYEYFRKVLAEMAKHPNPRYFVLKSIMLNNLYGVDIMEEATEICKLRLFLKLVAQMEPQPKKQNFGLEPLPDIDFNIRPGNTLVGFASLNEVCEAMARDTQTGQGRLIFDDGVLNRIVQGAVAADMEFKRFKSLQVQDSIAGADVAESKRLLKAALAQLREELDRYLAEEYELGLSKKSGAFQKWKESHQLFHWFVEFYSIINRGGFDVIIGNPPYVEYKNVQNTYRVREFKTIDCSDLYAFTIERSLSLLFKKGRIGMIVPISIVSTDGFDSLRKLLKGQKYISWNLNFAERPSKLFTGVEKRLTIWLTSKISEEIQTLSYLEGYKRWLAEERDNLFAQIKFVKHNYLLHLVSTSIPKISSAIEANILTRLSEQKPLKAFFSKGNRSIIYYTRKLRYFVQFCDFVPRIVNSQGEVVEPSELKMLSFSSNVLRDVAIAALNSSLFFWFFNCYSDVRNVNRREIEEFRLSMNEIESELVPTLSSLANELMQDFQINSQDLTNNYGKYGVLTIQSFQPRLSKPIIDEIDRILAQHYGFTEEELDFIINYDIKYRMGRDSGGED
ncbi:type IIS restriction enzyme Eco57I [Microcystis aeruginosa NIES-4325]|uniref:site-specific DNA-methyltransferase (adenine-specific) n=1 Tax=Microcystis aeruginosa NIES-4325 TaxID=2569534 RepID=A0A5J4F7Q9_MICAE|nr:DNA methyltransferase [Microcystis aeruginosa]GEA27107.1 type IIS restriction enzyme Eco57I [Microcystis aeruginosa NIES-4325]